MNNHANTIRIAVIVLAWLLLTAILILVSPKQTTPTQYQVNSVVCSDGSNATVRTQTISGETIVTYWCDGGTYVRH